MNFLKLLGVVAEKIESFFGAISYLDALYLAGIVAALTFLLLASHVLVSAKAGTSRASRRMSRYFENVYIGSSYEAGKFYKKKKHLMNRKARESFGIFMRSSVPITHTDFVEAVADKGRHSLRLVLSMHNVTIVLIETFLIMKGMLGGLSGVELFLYVGVPFALLSILHFVIYSLIAMVNREYHKNVRRLGRAVTYIDFNTYHHPCTREDDMRYMASPERMSRIDNMASRLEETGVVEDVDSVAIVDETALHSLVESIEGTVPNM